MMINECRNWGIPEPEFEDIIEIAIRGIEIDSKEYFIKCFLKKELIKQLKHKFVLINI